jgi:hypothetical protein
MKATTKILVSALTVALGVFGTTTNAVAGSHLWESWAVYSNADGTIQFVEIKETHGDSFENGLGGHTMISHPSGVSKGMHNVTGDTAFTYYLLGTAAYAALPGAPPLDEVLPNNFIAATDTSMEYSFTNTASWTLGQLPTNGVNMLTKTAPLSSLVSQSNFATNFAGVTGCVDPTGTAVSLPGVPERAPGTPVRADRLVPNGSSLSVTWDGTTCSDTFDHNIVYGQRSGFPAKPGGLYTTLGGVCSVGSTGAFTWNSVPAAADGSGLLWFLVVSTDGAGSEGPWGSYNGINDRNGTGSRCSSGLCGATVKSLAATCGH